MLYRFQLATKSCVGTSYFLIYKNKTNFMFSKEETNRRNENRRKLKLKREKEGKCIYCGHNEPKEGTKGCDICLKSKIEKNKTIKNRNERKRQKDIIMKYEVIKKYGGVCYCCGEKEILFLTIDHINNDGKKDRDGYFYNRLRKGDIRKDLQVLCFNCNLGKSVNGGVCPHISVNRLPCEVEDGRRKSVFDRNTKIEWPSDDDLIKMCNESSIRKVAKDMGVVWSTIISRLKRRNKYHLIKNY